MSAPEGIVVRRGSPSDAVSLSALAASTFSDTYGAQNTPEDLRVHLATHFRPEVQARELADPSMVILILEVDGAPAGYAQLTEAVPPESLPAGGGMFLWRFYLDRNWIGKGLAQPLMTAVVAAARGRGADFLWLTVWEQNPRAVAYYRKSGWVIAGQTTFVLGNDAQRDWLMTLPLGLISGD